jgi:hypothetical protein
MKPRQLTQTPFLLVPMWVYEAVGADGSTMRVYLTILARNLTERTAPRRLDWLIDAADLSRSTVYEALASLRQCGALIETDAEWSLPRDRPLSDQPDDLSDQPDDSSGRSDDASLLENLENTEGSSTPATLGDRGFVEFWTEWPARNGKKLNKAKALAIWRRLNLDERKAAWRGARNYAAASNARAAGAMDAFRWLRDRLWDDWQEPADLSGVRGAKPGNLDNFDNSQARRSQPGGEIKFRPGAKSA